MKKKDFVTLIMSAVGGMIEESVVGGYKKIEDNVVGGYKKIEDKFVEQFLTKDGEDVESAKKRIAKEQAEREKLHDELLK